MGYETIFTPFSLIMSQTIFVEVKIQIEDDVDVYDAIENCEYSFTGDGILNTEIINMSEDSNY